MPANLTPEYKSAEEAFRRATTVEEKIDALERMLSVIPKHKGTDKLQGELKKRLSKLRQGGGDKTSKSSSNPFLVEPHGAGQIPVVGFPNVGKSSLLTALTNATAAVGPYPFTTTLPQPGMMSVKDISIQLVDTPPLITEGLGELVAALQRADAYILVADVGSDECLEQLTESLQLLQRKHLIGQDLSDTSALVALEACLFVANKCDLPQAEENLLIVQELFPHPILPVSAKNGVHLDDLRLQAFAALGVVRIYSKIPGKPADMEAPFTIARGSTVLEFAQAVHRDLAENLKGARVWGSAKFDGQNVARDYVLADGDIVELRQ